MRPQEQFKSKDIDLITYLRFKGFFPISNPIQDKSGTRWAIFKKTRILDCAVLEFLSGNREAQLLNEFRKTRSFLLDSPAEKEIEQNETNYLH